MTDFAHTNGMLAIAVVNPLAMSVLKPPGEWGDAAGGGADVLQALKTATRKEAARVLAPLFFCKKNCNVPIPRSLQ